MIGHRQVLSMRPKNLLIEQTEVFRVVEGFEGRYHGPLISSSGEGSTKNVTNNKKK